MTNKVPDIVTPCCGMPLLVLTRLEGRSYMQYEVPDEICCMGENCYNAWDAKGVADGCGRMPPPEDQNVAGVMTAEEAIEHVLRRPEMFGLTRGKDASEN